MRPFDNETSCFPIITQTSHTSISSLESAHYVLYTVLAVVACIFLHVFSLGLNVVSGLFMDFFVQKTMLLPAYDKLILVLVPLEESPWAEL
jgi:hypothetical protein